MSQATEFGRFIDRSPSCPVSYGWAVSEVEGHRRVVVAATANLGPISELPDSKAARVAWIAIAASIPPSKETSPVGTPPEMRFRALPQPEQVESALKVLNQDDDSLAEFRAHKAYWDFLALNPGICPAGDF